MIYFLQEKVRYLKSVNDIRDGGKKDFTSGNLFESLATTNPELFDMYKLRQLEHSDNLMEAFNAYFDAIQDKDMERYEQFATDLQRIQDQLDQNPDGFSNFFTDWNDGYNILFNRFNIVQYFTIQEDIEVLSKESGLTRQEILGIIDRNYCPESLSEDGIRKLIKVRIANNKILIDGLLKMLMNNYTLLDLSLAEAMAMSNKLSDDRTSHEVLGDIKRIFKNPSILQKFKAGTNYDFRPIGGAYIVMGAGMDLEGDAPDKYLINIFKYDAIVISHGYYFKGERIDTLMNGIPSNKDLVNRLIRVIGMIVDDDKDTESFMRIIPDSHKKMIISYHNRILGFKDRDVTDTDRQKIMKDTRKLFDSLIDLCGNDDLIPWYFRDIVLSVISMLDCQLEEEYVRYNKNSVEIDGRSSEWVCNPVSTATKRNLTHVIDIVRALKAEAFKNVYLSICNIGHVKLPADIRSSLDFKVTMGLNEIMKEDAVMTEAVTDDIKLFVQHSIVYVQKLKNRIRDFYQGMNTKISKIINKRFGDRKRFHMPGKLKLLCINGNKCNYTEVLYYDRNQLYSHVNLSNKSIIKMIDRLIEAEDKMIKRLNRPGKSIFESIEFI